MGFSKFLIISICVILVVCYVYNKSVINYLTQSYHINIEIHDRYIQDVLSLGSEISSFLESLRVNIFDPTIESNRDKVASREEYDNFIPKKEEVIQSHKEIPQVAQGTRIDGDRLYVESNATFLLIGDSMMQGIGMTLVSALSKKGFKSINIAKQSTGLTYKDFFNWEQTLQDALENNPHVSIIVVCLGANDPWDMKGDKFGSDKWDYIYNERIRHIYSIAKLHNALVVWYEAPAVRRNSLNTKLLKLNEFYANNAKEQGGLFIKAQKILDQGKFITYVKNDQGRSVRVRTQDGIHFTKEGSLLLTSSLLDRIQVDNNTSTSKDPASNKEDIGSTFTQQPQPMPIPSNILLNNKSSYNKKTLYEQNLAFYHLRTLDSIE